MNNKEHVKLLTEFLERQNEKVRKNCYVQGKTDQIPLMLHVSRNPTIKEFSPIIGHRQADSEDRSVPRVCVAETLVGCMIGYSSLLYDFNQRNDDPKQKEWKGGYYLYGIEYEACLSPNKHLVYDAEVSGEKWLVNYTQGTDVYKHRKIGKLFIKSINTERIENKKEINADFYLEIEESIWLNAKVKLEKGYYLIKGPIPDQVKNYKTNAYQVLPISEDEYKRVKKLTVSLLSYKDNKAFSW